MKYSVVIPTYTTTMEHLKVLERCVDSVGANSKDYELIIVDDGSHLPVQEYATPKTWVIHEHNRGIPVSWNDGIRVARGEYIAVINDDITVQEGWLEKLRMALEDDDDNLVAAPGVQGKQDGGGIEEDYQWFPGYCFMMRRSTFGMYGYFDEQFSPFNYEDTDMWTRLLSLGGKLVRNYSTTITHLEGHVLHTLDYTKVDTANKQKFIKKHGFDPIPVFYEGAKAPW